MANFYCRVLKFMPVAFLSSVAYYIVKSNCKSNALILNVGLAIVLATVYMWMLCVFFCYLYQINKCSNLFTTTKCGVDDFCFIVIKKKL